MLNNEANELMRFVDSSEASYRRLQGTYPPPYRPPETANDVMEDAIKACKAMGVKEASARTAVDHAVGEKRYTDPGELAVAVMRLVG